MLFSRKNWKNLDIYKTLDTVNLEKAEIDFEKALQHKHILHCSYTNMSTTCAVLYEDADKIIYHYHAQYAYRLFCVYKAQKNKAVFLGFAGAFACYFHDKIFTIGDGPLSIGNHYMLMIDPKTGEKQGFDFLGKGVIVVSGLGSVSKYCQDWIIDMKGNPNAITLKIRRRKAELPAGVTDPYNIDMDYLLQIQYQNGQFAATRISPEAIIKKGPWTEEEKSPYSMNTTSPYMGELTEADKKSTQIDAFFESKPKIDAFLKIDANAQSRNTKWHPDQRLWKQDAIRHLGHINLHSVWMLSRFVKLVIFQNNFIYNLTDLPPEILPANRALQLCRKA